MDEKLPISWRARRDFELLTPQILVWCSAQRSAFGRAIRPRVVVTLLRIAAPAQISMLARLLLPQRERGVL